MDERNDYDDNPTVMVQIDDNAWVRLNSIHHLYLNGKEWYISYPADKYCRIETKYSLPIIKALGIKMD